MDCETFLQKLVERGDILRYKRKEITETDRWGKRKKDVRHLLPTPDSEECTLVFPSGSSLIIKSHSLYDSHLVFELTE
jgi:hypothetical protein